jgi:Leucine-rich repeat (LRR) protein
LRRGRCGGAQSRNKIEAVRIFNSLSLPNVTVLNLSHNHIEELDGLSAMALPRLTTLVGSLASVQEAALNGCNAQNLSANRISSTDQVANLSYNTAMHSLDLSGNPLSEGNTNRLWIIFTCGPQPLPNLSALRCVADDSTRWQAAVADGAGRGTCDRRREVRCQGCARSACGGGVARRCAC